MNNKELALCILAKYPIAGNVKTRLSKSVGDYDAVALYKKLLLNTITQVKRAQIPNYLFVANADLKYRNSLVLFLKNNVDTIFFAENSLNSLICHIFDEFLNKQKYKKVIVMCSDSPFIDPVLIHKANNELKKENTMFISPSSDGGYSLIGLNNFIDLFSTVLMGKKNVFKNTVDLAKNAGLNVRSSYVVDDIDTFKDVLSVINRLNDNFDPEKIIRNQLKKIIKNKKPR